MSDENRKALIKPPAPEIRRADIMQGLEAAFIALLQSKSAPAVSIDRRIFLTIAESAQLAGLPPSFIRKLLSDGTIKGIRAGRAWRVPRTEVEALPEKLARRETRIEALPEAEERDLALNKLRRLGLLPPTDIPPDVQ